MNLEQRVQALELELQILKNQVQATLLDIREQLLNNTYPALQAENPAPVQSPAPAPVPPTPQPVRPPDSAKPDAPVSQVRQVSLKDIQTDDDDEPQDRIPTYMPSDAPTTPARPGNGAAKLYPNDLPAPVPMRRSPAEDTRRNGPADPALIRRALPENNRVSNHRPLGASRPAARPFVTEAADVPPFIIQTELITEADWASLSLLESWAEQKVQQIGAKHTKELIKAYAAQGRFDSKMKEALLQLVTIISSEDDLPLAPYTPPADPPKHGATSQPDADTEQLPQNLILKLIAGVQNAGTNTTRRKNNG
ncbi:MAG: hypothetical protein HY866_08330 [Chloroflexi bacterium]|nr:hypothetical protein [Chloroflexota bacterium]